MNDQNLTLWKEPAEARRSRRVAAAPVPDPPFRPLPDGPVRFFARGVAQPKGSAKGFAMPVKGQVDKFGRPKYRAIITTDNSRLKAWERVVWAEALIAAKGCHFGAAAVRVTLEFLLPRPPSVSAGKRPFPTIPPDLDKLARGAIDGLHPALFDDDAQVVGITCRKSYVHPPEAGVTVTVELERP